MHSLPLSYDLGVRLAFFPDGVQLTGQDSVRQLSIDLLLGVETPPGYDFQPVLASTPQSLISDALVATSYLYSLATIVGSPSASDKRLPGATGINFVHAINDGYYQPYTAATCGEDVIEGLSDESPVYFPISPLLLDRAMVSNATLNNSIFLFPPGASPRGADYLSAIQYSGITRSQLLETPGDTSEYRLKFVELPQDLFNGSAIGAVVLAPRDPRTQKQAIMLCTLGAGWGTSLLNLSSTAFNPESGHVASVATNPGIDIGHDFQDGVVLFGYPEYPEKHIIINESWANYLNPFIPSLNTTVVNALMSNQPKNGYPFHILTRIVLSGLLANGLSRTVFTGQLEGTLKTNIPASPNASDIDGAYWLSGKGDMFSLDPAQSKDWVKLEVVTTVKGYAYSRRGVGPKFAIGVLVTYCFVAVAHLLYAAITGISSTSWGSIAEVTALAMNSTPTEKLRNTCAGITKTRAFKLPVRILSARNGESDGEHLELVFGEVDEKVAAKGSIKLNRAYGTMAGKVKVT